jgi:hypothetical protein
VSLGLDQSPLALPDNARPTHKSAGLAFLVSLIVPGAGQMYCGKTARGVLTLVFFLGGVALSIAAFSAEQASASEEIAGIGVMVALVLYVFSFLDAYYLAREINAGTEWLVDPNNPRVAVTLNLLTNGFGYWYLGERNKGWTAFIVLGILMRALSRALGDSPWSVLLLLIPSAMALDAYRIAHRQIEERRAAPPPAPSGAPAPETRLPAAIPVALACILPLGFLALAALGLAMPSFEPIDQSRAVTNQQSDPKSYENPKYGVRFVVPTTWELDQSDKAFLVKAETLDGACQVALMGQGSLPVRSVGSEMEALSQELLQKNGNYHRTGERPIALGNITEGREVQFVAIVEEQGVIQRYLVARKNMALYVLITTMASAYQPKCEKDVEGIRQNVRIGN